MVVNQTLQDLSQTKRHSAVLQRMKRYAKCLFAMGVLSFLVIPQAQAIQQGTYLLHNHPNGGIRPPLYGLRLDGLLGDSSKEYTFDFDHVDSAMTLTWDGTKIVIAGQSFGGEDVGGDYGAGTTDVWNIHFEYAVGISQPGDGGFDDLIVNSDNANFGSISSSFGTFELEDQSNNSGLAFRFGDGNGGGHRNFNGISGWGWVNHGTDCINGDCAHVYASDWLFTADTDPVATPEPTTMALFGTGLAGLGLLRYRKSRREK